MYVKRLFPMLLAAMVSLAACAAESYYVVCTTGMTGGKEYEVMNKEKLAEKKKLIAAEARFFQKALSKVQKEWMLPENKDSHQFRWQGQKLKPRTIKESQPYPSLEKAQAKADKLSDKEMGLDEKGKKKSKKLTEKEEEKLYREKMRDSELESLAGSVQKEIESLMNATPQK